MVVAAGGTASAALVQPDGTGVPLYVQGGHVGLPTGTNSVRATVSGTSNCMVVNNTNNLNSGLTVREGDVVTVDAFTDRACQGSRIGPGVSYRLTYGGPSPKNKFSAVIVRAQNPKVVFCADGGWSGNHNGQCREG